MTTEEYGEGVGEQLDAIEFDDSRRSLWNSICAVINTIFDKPDSIEVRKRRVDTQTGIITWLVPLRSTGEDEDWAVMWTETAQGPMIVYVGPWPPIS